MREPHSRSFMRLIVLSFAAALVAPLARPAVAQSPLAPDHQFSVDLSVAGLNAGYAVRTSDRTSFGASVGVGGNWVNGMLIGGRHFADANGLSYAQPDGSTDKALAELLRVGLFTRRHFAAGRQLDLGFKASVFLHSDSSDDDPGVGGFLGLNATAMWWNWRWLRLGSEVDVGRYAEPGAAEFGLSVAPLLLRATIP